MPVAHDLPTGPQRFVTISRPEKYNALNRETLEELDVCFSHLADDKELGAVVVTGAGEKAFIAGADINELAVLDAIGAEVLTLLKRELHP